MVRWPGLGHGTGAVAACSIRSPNRNQLRGPGLLHGDPVEQIGCLDGPGVVSHDDELGGGTEFADEGGEAIHVEIIQGSVDLVQYDEGAGIGRPQGHEEGDGPEGLLAARQERKSRGPLAWVPHPDFHPGLLDLVAVAQDQLCFAPSEETLPEAVELFADGSQGLREAFLYGPVALEDAGFERGDGG